MDAASEAPTGPSDAVDVRVVKALAHPTRVRILNVLRDRELASPVELSAELGLALGTVGYHVRRLETLGFIELAKRTQRRGAVEHHYRACATLGPPARPADGGAASALAAGALDACQTAHAALGHGGFDAVAAAATVRLLTLDAPGREELQRAARLWGVAIGHIERASARRLTTEAKAAAAHACSVVTIVFGAASGAD